MQPNVKQQNLYNDYATRRKVRQLTIWISPRYYYGSDYITL